MNQLSRIHSAGFRLNREITKEPEGALNLYFDGEVYPISIDETRLSVGDDLGEHGADIVFEHNFARRKPKDGDVIQIGVEGKPRQPLRVITATYHQGSPVGRLLTDARTG